MVAIQCGEFSDQELNAKLDELYTSDTAGQFICSFCSKSTRHRRHMRDMLKSMWMVSSSGVNSVKNLTGQEIV